MEDGLNSEALLKRLKAISDIKEFADEVYKALVKFRVDALEPELDEVARLGALNRVLEIFIEHEEYEKCSFIRDLINELHGK